MNPIFNKPFTFDRAIRLLIGIAIGVMLFLLVRKLSGVILPFLIALLFAYMIFPIVKFFQYKLRVKFRIIAIILTLVGIFGVITLLIMLATPFVRSEYMEVHILVSHFINNTSNFESIVPVEWIEFVKRKLALLDLQNLFTTQNIIQFVETMSSQIWRFVAGSFNILISLFVIFIIFLYIIFILLDYETLEKGWARLVPEKYRPFAIQLASDVQTGMNKYFRSQALIAFIVGLLFATGFKIISFPLGITLGLFMGMLNLVPYLQTLGLLPMILLAAIKASSTNESFFLIFLSALIVLAVVQVIQDMFLVPKIMGRTTGLKPAVILLSLSIWGVLLGLVGLIIALPMTTLLISYYKRFILNEPEVVEVEAKGKTTAVQPPPNGEREKRRREKGRKGGLK
ncbi:MAG: AI-2E family transporter [Lentimicrobiaceae bacterium]|nr:AI-2E family transporter [Lentimicrobiaceae bacterium]